MGIFLPFTFLFLWFLKPHLPHTQYIHHKTYGIITHKLCRAAEGKKERSYFGWSYLVLPDSSVCKESACSAGDPSSISGLGRSPGEGIGFPLQCSWVSLVAQLVKNPLVVWETWVRSLGWEDPLKKGKATHSNILAWRIPGLQRDMTERLLLWSCDLSLATVLALDRKSVV